MLTIRLARVGKKNKAQFKVMVQEKRMAPGGRHVEILGSYNPHSKEVILKEERIKFWLSQGAQTSDTVHNLLVSQKVIDDKKRAVKMPAKKTEEKTSEEKDGTKKDEAEKEIKEKKEENKTESIKAKDEKTAVSEKEKGETAKKEKVETKKIEDEKGTDKKEAKD